MASGCGRWSPSPPPRSAGRRRRYDVVHGGVACELVHLGFAVPRRRHRRGRHPPRGRDRQRQVGQPAGDPRRRLPAVAGIRDRCLARHRGRRSAGPHDRLAVRGRDRAAPPHLRRAPARGQLLRVDPGQDGVAVRHGGPHRRDRRRPRPPDIDALTAWGNAFGMVFQIVDDILDITDTDRAARQARRPRPRRGCVHAAGAADVGDRAAASARSWPSLLGTPARHRRARQGAGDRAGQRGRRERGGDGPPVRRRRRGGVRRPPDRARRPTPCAGAPSVAPRVGAAQLLTAHRRAPPLLGVTARGGRSPTPPCTPPPRGRARPGAGGWP